MLAILHGLYVTRVSVLASLCCVLGRHVLFVLCVKRLLYYSSDGVPVLVPLLLTTGVSLIFLMLTLF